MNSFSLFSTSGSIRSGPRICSVFATFIDTGQEKSSIPVRPRFMVLLVGDSSPDPQFIAIEKKILARLSLVWQTLTTG